jgi:uncharacterized RDD family membrane protein YckC
MCLRYGIDIPYRIFISTQGRELVMTQGPGTLSYAVPSAPGVCPLCNHRPTGWTKIYGHPVCKKCYYKLANRRQSAFVVDNVLLTVPVWLIGRFIQRHVTLPTFSDLAWEVLGSALALLLMSIFALKDGFGGQSPGKRLAGVQVLDDRTGRPISFDQSFKRNAIFLVGCLPFVGNVASLIVLITIMIQLGKGRRLGDRFAGTRVIWKKHARSVVFGGDGLICETCGYDLIGNQSGVCPECGVAVSEQNRARLATANPAAK